MGKMWSIRTRECYSAFRKEILPYVTTWVNLEDKMWRSQSQKDRLHLSFLYEGPNVIERKEAEERMGAAGAGGGEGASAVRWVCSVSYTQ